MRDDLPAGRLTLLQSDIEGSTRLLHRLGAEGYALAQAEHREVLRAAFGAEGGVEVDTQGDSFFFVFPSALAGVRGAVAGTRGLATFNWSHGDAVKVRIGLHSGEPQPTEEGYVGMVVNTSARISAIGHGGQILLSEDTAGEFQTEQAELTDQDVSLRDLGGHRLKDLEQPLKLYQVVIPELPSDFPPPRSAELRPNNLPVPLTPFIGRADLVNQIRDLLARPDCRAVTLLGPGGTGKTRLGIRVGNELLHSMEDGAYFVGLAALQDPALVLPEIALALKIKEEAGQPLLDTLIAELAPREMLLILDNFEQVQPAARAVAALLAGCPGIKILATSRQPLRISGERGFPVPTLALPDADQPLPELEAIRRFEAIRLFVDRAQGVQWDFELNDANAADVVAICRKVDSLPLAIELATARLYAMSPKQLLEALDQRLNVLTEGAVDLLDHQQTLRDLVAWSYELLDEEQKVLWRRLAVFSGGGSMSAVQAICNPDDAYQLPGDVDDLASRSLLNLEFDQGAQTDEDGSEVTHRVTMLETLREYAREQLDESDEGVRLQISHADWFCQLAERAAAELRGPRLEQWLERFDKEQANLRAAMACGFEGRGSADTAARVIGVLYFYFYQRGQLTEGDNWLSQAVAREADLEPGTRARVYFGLANMERNLGRIDGARDHCETALELFRVAQDDEGVADALSQLAAIHQHGGEFEKAEAAVSESIERFRSLGNEGRLAFALVTRGVGFHLQGDLPEAIECYSESLEFARRVGDQNYIATALVNLGEALMEQEALDQAAVHLREGLTLYLALGVRNQVAFTLEQLAGIDAAEQRFAEAAVLYAAADRLREEINAPLEAFNVERYEQILNRVREGLGESDYAAAWEQGRSLSLHEAVDAAQHDLDQVTDS